MTYRPPETDEELAEYQERRRLEEEQRRRRFEQVHENWREGMGAQMGCDFETCPDPAVTHVIVRLKNHSYGGARDVFVLAVCAHHLDVGVPAERRPPTVRFSPDDG